MCLVEVWLGLGRRKASGEFARRARLEKEEVFGLGLRSNLWRVVRVVGGGAGVT